MEYKFCSECGEKLDKDSNFCPSCGFKLIEEEKKTKFCHNCGEKIDFKAEICPKCGVRVENPLINSANKVINKSKKEANTFFSEMNKFIHSKIFLILVLVVVLICILAITPNIIDFLTPYKEVDSSYIANPTPGEKVKFTGEYIGTTTWNKGLYYFVPENDVVRVGDQYIIIQGTSTSHHLTGFEGHDIYLEGKFPGGGKSKEPTNVGDIYGYWFSADKIEIR